MIGNDIVDLAKASNDSNWRRARFLDRVFTSEEQERISNSAVQHQTVWRLWSMKEAAYKAYVRETGHQFFNPKKLHCDFISTTEGSVKIFENVYYTTSEVTEIYIHSIASAEANFKSKSLSFILKDKNPSFQSDAVRSVLIDYMSKSDAIAETDLQIKTDAFGVPDLYCKTKKFSKGLSLSHHGAYGAFAIC